MMMMMMMMIYQSRRVTICRNHSIYMADHDAMPDIPVPQGLRREDTSAPHHAPDCF